MSLSTRIQQVRLSTGLNKIKFGKLCGVSHAAVGLWENGETKSIKFSVLMKMQRETGYNASWIDTGKGTKYVTDDTDTQRERVKQKLALLSDEQKHRLNTMTIDEISTKIHGLKTDQQLAIQAMLDSWETQTTKND